MKEQIEFICKLNNIEYTKEFIDFVYNKKLPYFSGELLKKIKKDFNKKLESKNNGERYVCAL